VFVRDRSFNDENEWINSPVCSFIEELHELLTVFKGEELVMEVHFWYAGNAAEQDLFETWLRRCSHGNRVSITTESGSDPEEIDFFDWLNGGRLTLIGHDCDPSMVALVDRNLKQH
jgi:hypothetical protein